MMGIYDRDYAREEHPPAFQLRWPRTAVNQIVLICAVLAVLDQILAIMVAPTEVAGKRELFHLMRVMAATPHSIVSPAHWWQLLTCGFAHSYMMITHVIFNMFGLWMFGREVEEKYGKSEFWRVYLLAILLGAIFWCTRVGLTSKDGFASGGSVLGASGAVTAVIILFVLNFPQRQLYLMGQVPLKAWVLGVIVIVLNFIPIELTEEDKNTAYDVHLVGAAFAAVYFYGGLNLGKLFGLGGLANRRRPKLRVHNPDIDEVDYSDQNELADRLLDKVRDHGEESLTAKERKILEDYSRRMRQKHR